MRQEHEPAAGHAAEPAPAAANARAASAPARVLELQRSCGNAAVAQLVRTGGLTARPPRLARFTGNLADRPIAAGDPDVMDADRAAGPNQATYQRIQGQRFVQGATDSADIDPNDVQQRVLGDCWFLAAVAAVAIANREAIRRLIDTTGEDGLYEVSFYERRTRQTWFGLGADEVSFHRVRWLVDDRFPTVGGNARYAQPGDRTPTGTPELWVMLLEKAWAASEGSYQRMHGGNLVTRAGGALSALTGQEYTSHPLGGDSRTDAQVAADIAGKLAANRALVCGFGTFSGAQQTAASAAGVSQSHGYAIRAVNTTANTIDLHNPWGFRHVTGLPMATFRQLCWGYVATAGPVR